MYEIILMLHVVRSIDEGPAEVGHEAQELELACT
jgi:hypothetical protein